MGRGNVYHTMAAHNAVWYVDNSVFMMYDEDDNMLDEWDAGFFDDEISYLKALLIDKDKSLVAPLKARNGGRRYDEGVMLENDYIEIRIVDNEQSVAFVVFENVSMMDYNDAMSDELVMSEIKRVGELVRDVLLTMYKEIYKPRGAWLSDIVKREEQGNESDNHIHA